TSAPCCSKPGIASITSRSQPPSSGLADWASSISATSSRSVDRQPRREDASWSSLAFRPFSRARPPAAETDHGPLASPSLNGYPPSGRSLDARAGRSPSRSRSWARSTGVTSWAMRVIEQAIGMPSLIPVVSSPHSARTISPSPRAAASECEARSTRTTGSGESWPGGWVTTSTNGSAPGEQADALPASGCRRKHRGRDLPRSHRRGRGHRARQHLDDHADIRLPAPLSLRARDSTAHHWIALPRAAWPRVDPGRDAGGRWSNAAGLAEHGADALHARGRDAGAACWAALRAPQLLHLVVAVRGRPRH